MAYYQDPEDPYGSYDPQAPPDSYVTEEESFEFYDEGTDPYGEDALYLSDGVDEYPEDGMEYEYDEEYDEEADGMMYEDDLLFQDDWLPLPPEEIPIETLPIEQRPEDYGSQLLIGGLQHPDPASMRDSYCQFYPEACLEGAGLSGREPFNRTEVAEELDRTLKDIDMTGLAIAAILILILLFGLHYGGGTEAAPAAPPTAKDVIRSRLKAAGYVDPELSKRVADIMKLDENKRETEIEKAIKNKYESRLGAHGKTGSELADAVDAIMATPDKDRPAKYKELTGAGPPVLSEKEKADAADRTKYDELLRTAGLRGEARKPKLEEVMAEPADKRQAKCDEIIAKLDPERVKWETRLDRKGIKEPQLTEFLNAIMAEPKEGREAKYTSLTKKPASNPTAPPSTDPVVDPDIARYTRKLTAAGFTEPRLTEKLDEILKLPSADREAKYTDIVAAEKADRLVASADKPMSTAELSNALKGYGYTDSAERQKLVGLMKPKSLADQKADLEGYKLAKEKEIAEKETSRKKAELTTKLKAAGVTDPKTLDEHITKLMPMTVADQATEIGKIKAGIEAKKASDAEKKAKDNLRVALNKQLKEGGYKADAERAGLVEGLMKLESEAREKRLKELIDAKKTAGAVPPSTSTENTTRAAEEAVKLAAQAALKTKYDKDLKDAGYTDQKEIDRMVKNIIALPDEKSQKAKFEDYKGRAPKGSTTTAETPEQIAAKKAVAEAAMRADLDKKLLTGGYTDKADRDAKVNQIMEQKDEPARKNLLTQYLRRPPGSQGGPPAIVNPSDAVDPVVPPGDPVIPPGTDKKALDAAEIERQLRKRGFKDPKAIEWITGQVLAKTTPEDQQKELNTYIAIPSKNRGALEKDFAKKQADKDKADNGVVPGPNPPEPGTTPPLSDADFQAKLEKHGYTPPSVENMMKEYKAAPNDAAKKALSDKLLVDGTNNRKKIEDEYKGKVVGDAHPPGGQPANEISLDDKLKAIGYNEAARKRMLDHLKRTIDPEEKKIIQNKLLNKGNMKAYVYRYSDDGLVPQVNGEKDRLNEILKKRKYDDATRLKMLAAWEGAKKNVDRENIYNQITSEDEGIIAKNKVDYGPGGTGPPPPLETTATAHREAMDKMLSDAGYDDKDAREEILDEIIKEGGTPAEQIGRLERGFIQRSPPSREKLNEEYAKKRKSKNAAPLGADDPSAVDPATTSILPSDDDILEALKIAGWTDPDARQHILSRIKSKTTPEDQLKSYRNYARSGAGNEADNKKFGDEWRKKQAAGGDPKVDPSKVTKLPGDSEILQKLEDAGWTDPDAQKYLLDRIKHMDKDKKHDPNKRLADQLREYEAFTAPGTGTEKLNKEYGNRWRKDHPAGPKLSPEEKEIDDQLRTYGYTDDARKKMLSELRDPNNKDNKSNMMADWLGKSPEEVDAVNKQKGKEQAAIDVANKAKKNGVVDPNAPPIPDLNAKVPKGTTPGGATRGDGNSEPWITGPQLMLLGLLLIPVFLVLSRGMTTPSGQSFYRMPTMPSLPALRGPWSSTPIMAGGIPVSTGLPELASKRKSKTRKTASSIPRMAVSHEKAVSGRGGGGGGSGPAISINNVNAQGRDIPININSGSDGGGSILGAVVEEVVVTEEVTVEETVVVEAAAVEEIVVEEQVVIEETPIITIVEDEGPIVIEFRGPSDPNRLFWMAVSLIVISIPLLIDYSSDWPERMLAENEYLSAMYHWIILGVATFFLFLRLDRAYHWTTRYGRPLIRVTRRLPGMITPAIVGTVEGTERLVWGIDDALFGKSQEMLGLVLATSVFLVAAMSDPHDAMDKVEYTEGFTQFMPLLAIAFVTFLFHNAAAAVYY